MLGAAAASAAVEAARKRVEKLTILICDCCFLFVSRSVRMKGSEEAVAEVSRPLCICERSLRTYPLDASFKFRLELDHTLCWV